MPGAAGSSPAPPIFKQVKNIRLKYIFFLAFPLILNSQIGPTKGLRKNPSEVFALKNAKIIVNSEKTIENGTIIIRNGIIENVGKNIKIPSDAHVIDCSEKWIYPGFTEPYLVYKEEKERKPSMASYIGPETVKKEEKGTGYWNPEVHPEKDITDVVSIDDNLLKKYHESGFTTAVFVADEGIFKGKSALLSLKHGKLSENLIKKDLFQHIEFYYHKRGNEYPNSLMGSIALVRQTFYDAIWHKNIWDYYIKHREIKKPPFIKSLESLESLLYKKQKVVFNTDEDLDIYNVIRLTKEFNLNSIIRGSGYEYRQIEILKKEKLPIILPLNFPEKLDLENPEEAVDITLEEMKHWEYAPFNPKKLWENKIDFAFTTYGLKDTKSFLNNLKEAIKRGLPENYALKALTEIPAKLIGVYDILGSVEKGKLANLIITDGNIFEDGEIWELWIDGENYRIKEELYVKPQGKWEITFYFPEKEFKAELEIKGDFEKLKGDILFDKEKISLKDIKISLRHLEINLESDKIGYPGITFFSGIVVKGTFKGKGILPDGREFK